MAHAKKHTIDNHYSNSTTNDAIDININVSLHFLDATTVSIIEDSKENTYNYTIINDMLAFNYRTFSIIELTNNKLTLQEESTTVDKLEFRRIETNGY